MLPLFLNTILTLTSPPGPISLGLVDIRLIISFGGVLLPVTLHIQFPQNVLDLHIYFHN